MAIEPRNDSTFEVHLGKHKVGDHLQVRLSGGRIVEATIKAIVETTEGMRLQVSFGDETAKIFLWQIVEGNRS